MCVCVCNGEKFDGSCAAVLAHLAGTLASAAGRASFASRGAPRAMIMSVAAWLASLLAAGGVGQTFSLKEKPFDPYV